MTFSLYIIILPVVTLTHSRQSHHDCPLRKKKRNFKPRVVRPIVDGKGLKSQKEPRSIKHGNLHGDAIVDDDNNDLLPPPDDPPMLVTLAKGDNLESKEAINNKSRGINYDHYFNEDFMSTMVNLSNVYDFEQKRSDPKLICWENKKKAIKTIKVQCMNHFFAQICYFGIVRLPSKRDYWLQNCEWLPSHPICQVNGMTSEQFEFL